MAGGKVLIGGTAYDITKGKTLIGGTAYDITAGKTLVSGTAEDIVFAKPSIPPTIDTLMRDMTVVKDASRNLSTRDYVSIPTSTISSGLYYVFQFCGTATTIYKFKNGVLTFLNGCASGSGAGVALYNSSLYSGSTYDTTNFTNVTRHQVYGGTIAAVEFPSFKEYESEIDTLLGAWSPQNPNGMALENIAGRNSSSTAYVRNNNSSTLGYYIVARFKQWGSSYTGSGEDTAGISIFYGSAFSDWEMINQVTPNWAGGHLASGYLTLGSCYGGTIALLY